MLTLCTLHRCDSPRCVASFSDTKTIVGTRGNRRAFDTGHVTMHLPARCSCSFVPALLFSKLNQIFFGYFDPENILLDKRNEYISG